MTSPYPTRRQPPGRTRHARRLAPAAAFLLALVLILPVWPRVSLAAGKPPAGAVQAQLVQVIDGDTIDVLLDDKVERVRYVGVDAPERSQPGYSAATEANRALLGAGPLYLVKDRSERDKTSDLRLLRYVYTVDGALVEQALRRAR